VTDASPGAEYIAPPAAAAPIPPRRRTPWRAAFFALAGVAIVAGVAWALLGDRLFVVRSIAVTGTHLVSTAQVIAAADVPLGTPLMRVNPGAVTRRVETIPQVASATVSEDWPDHVTIAVTERLPVLAVRMAGGGYDLLDPSGVIVRTATTRPRGLPVFVTPLPGSALRGDPGVAAAAAVLAELTPSLARAVTAVSVAQVPSEQVPSEAGPPAAAEAVTLSLDGARTVVWGDPGNGAAKDREIQILLRGSVKYLDVSAPGTAVAR
jgi:cell division protein FtsQ